MTRPLTQIFDASTGESFIREMNDVEYTEWLAQTNNSQRIWSEIDNATQARLDTFAQTRGYDNILSACTYAADPFSRFAAEGQYCTWARSTTWAKRYEMQAEAEAGTRQAPKGFADIESELPALVWPTELKK